MCIHTNTCYSERSDMCHQSYNHKSSMDCTWMNSLQSSPNGSIKKYGLIGKVMDNELSSVGGTHLGFALTCAQVYELWGTYNPTRLQH